MLRYSACAASKPGSKHKFLEENNQDAYALRRLDDGVVMAVSDGAGSRPHSRIGADLVSSMAAAFLTGVEWAAEFGPQAAGFLAEARAALALRAEEKGLTARDLACTVLAAVATSRGFRALQIGDGFIVTRSEASAPYRLLFPIVKGEHANETVFVTQSNAAEYMQTCEDDLPPHFICLSSDGVERQAIKLRESEPHPPFFEYLSKVAANAAGGGYLEQFLAMPSLDEVTDDDRTLVCAIRADADESAAAKVPGESG